MDRQAAFQALADPTRRQILHLLSARELPAGEIAQQFEVSWSTVSRHLSVLRGAGLVTSRRSSRQVLYRLDQEVIATVSEELGSIRSAEEATHPTGRMAEDASAQAREVFRRCLDEAWSLSAERVGTHHLLLALLSGPEGTARGVLDRAGVSYERAREAAISLFGHAAHRPDDPMGIPFEWTCKSVIGGGIRGEAIKLGHHVVGTGVQLLALLDEVERRDTGPPLPGKAVRVLAELGVDVAGLRADCLAEMDQSSDSEETLALAPVLDELGSTYQRMWEMFVGLESLLETRFGRIEGELQAIKRQVGASEADGGSTASNEP
ncbi:MAG TPA: metalloregulator ArsR/SmtB family transcription factor [Acidimicrobiales bacterium]|nr:metalloregulator ArsR/SmtB family transcription factor [Acidimicrobiales bacterium]